MKRGRGWLSRMTGPLSCSRSFVARDAELSLPRIQCAPMVPTRLVINPGFAWLIALRRYRPGLGLLEVGGVAGAVAHDLGLGLGKVDHGGRFGAAVARVDHRVDGVLELLGDLPSLDHGDRKSTRLN